MNKVALVVPDAGPLISLARADALELLLQMEIPVYVIDQVWYEVAQPQFRDGTAIRGFVEAHPEMIHVYETFVGSQAKAARDSGSIGRQTGLGEAAIAEFLNTYDLQFDDLSPLLIFEDSDISKSKFIIPDSVHVISTRAFLRGLEIDGLIASMEDIWAAIEISGRSPSKVEVDKPGNNLRGKSTWRRRGT